MTVGMIVLAGAMMLGMMFFMHGGHKGCGADEKPAASSTGTVPGAEAAPAEHAH